MNKQAQNKEIEAIHNRKKKRFLPVLRIIKELLLIYKNIQLLAYYFNYRNLEKSLNISLKLLYFDKRMIQFEFSGLSKRGWGDVNKSARLINHMIVNN